MEKLFIDKGQDSTKKPTATINNQKQEQVAVLGKVSVCTYGAPGHYLEYNRTYFAC